MSDNSWYEKGKLPPVGIKCIVDSKECTAKFVRRFHGKTVNILMHMTDHAGDEVAIFSMPDPSDKSCLCFHGMAAGCFKPIKTEREIAIDDMLKIAESAADKINAQFFIDSKSIQEAGKLSVFSALYDAGYRKTNTPD